MSVRKFVPKSHVSSLPLKQTLRRCTGCRTWVPQSQLVHVSEGEELCIACDTMGTVKH